MKLVVAGRIALVGLASALVTLLLAVSILDVSPVQLGTDLWFLVGFTALVSSLLVRTDGGVVGLVTGVLVAVFLIVARGSTVSVEPGLLPFLLLAVPIGALPRNTLVAICLALCLAIMMWIFQGLYGALASLALVLVSAATRVVVGKLVRGWKFPFEGLGSRVPHILAFAAGYLVIILFFALCYDTAYTLNPSGAFELSGDNIIRPNLSYFVYMSTRVITTSGPSVRPANTLSRALVTAELLVGSAWIVVVFGLLVKNLGDFQK